MNSADINITNDLSHDLFLSIEIALINDDVDYIKSIIDKISDINKTLYTRANRMSLIFYAVINEAENVTKFLIEQGADVNYDPFNDPLLFLAARKACISGKLNILKMLINKGAKGISLNEKDYKGHNILEELLYNKSDKYPSYNDVVKLLSTHCT